MKQTKIPKAKRARKLDSLHVRLDEQYVAKLSAIMDMLEPMIGGVNPSQAIRYAIGKAHGLMGEKPAA